MHGCIISAYIRHLRSLKIRLVHPPKIISLCRHCHLIVSFVVISLCHLTVPFHCAISLCRQCLLTVSSLSFHCVVIVVNILDQITKQTSRKSPPCCLGLRLRAWHQTSHTYWAGAPTLSAFCCTSKGPQSPACVCVCVCVCMCVYVCVCVCMYVCVYVCDSTRIMLQIVAIWSSRRAASFRYALTAFLHCRGFKPTIRFLCHGACRNSPQIDVESIDTPFLSRCLLSFTVRVDGPCIDEKWNFAG